MFFLGKDSIIFFIYLFIYFVFLQKKLLLSIPYL